MPNQEVENVLNACDELLSCKFLVAEYKITKVLKAIASSSDVCSLISECLESYNRDREFARTFIQDGHGQFACIMPTEEFKIVALVFCTLADIDNKKIDFTDFVKAYFGKEENAFEAFLGTMIVPFRDLIAEAFGFSKLTEEPAETDDQGRDEVSEDEEYEEDEEDQDKFEVAVKIAVQILSEIEECRVSRQVEDVHNIASSIVKTASLRDETVLKALTASLKYAGKGIKQIKFLVKELSDLVFD